MLIWWQLHGNKLQTVGIVSILAFVIPRTICEMILKVADDDGSFESQARVRLLVGTILSGQFCLVMRHSHDKIRQLVFSHGSMPSKGERNALHSIIRLVIQCILSHQPAPSLHALVYLLL